jgi:hypothetical protein
MAGYIINDTDTTTPLSFGTCETACGIVADLIGSDGFDAWARTWTDTLNGFSGVLWMCIELARHAEQHIETLGGWDAFGGDFYGTTGAIAEAILSCDTVGDTDAMKAAVEAAINRLHGDAKVVE